MSLEMIPTTFAQVRARAAAAGGIYVGSAIDPWTRATTHYSNGYRGVMYYATTTNIKYSENLLLQIGTIHNILERTGRDGPGYVYCIVGRKMY